MGASYGAFSTELRFRDGSEPAIAEHSVVAALGRRLGRDFSVRAAVGAVLGGSIELDQVRHEVGQGGLLSVSVAHRVSFAGRFFATFSASLGASYTSTRAPGQAGSTGLFAGDARIGALVGATFFERLSPYVLGRAFGGPVYWEIAGQDQTGTDQHHYQLGVGASLSLASGFSALLDASLVGERSVAVGISYAF